MFELRPYQKQAVESWISFFTGHRPYNGALMILPTWSWKSLVIANIALWLQGNIIILQPNKEILEQNYAKVMSYWMNDCGIFSASAWQKTIAKLTFATIWSIISRKELYSHFDNIIVDECHLVNHEGWQYADFIRNLWCKVLWLTATPYRLKHYQTGNILRFLTRTRNSIFQEVIHLTQIQDISSLWFLAVMKYYQIKVIDITKLKTNSTGVDYTDVSMRNHFDEVHLREKIAEVVERLVKSWRKHILVFTKFVSDSEYVASLVRVSWIMATTVSWETPKKEREEILKKFKSGEIQCVANVWVLTTGFDFPELDAIILARPTKSLWLYYQMVGRGMRPHGSKEDCRVVDMAENKRQFGEIKDLTIWNEWNKKRVVSSWWRVLTNIFNQ